MRDDFGPWLRAQGYSDNSCNSRQANVRTVERAYGETLDAVQDRGGLPALVGQMVYSSEDERRHRPNPSKVNIQGNLRNGLATLKGAVMLYAKFLGASWVDPDSAAPFAQAASPDLAGDAATFGGPEGQKLSLERDMQRHLRANIASLDSGLTVIDDGAERVVTSGFIDILARDADGALVVIELKAGKTDARVVGQVLGYMGDIADEDSPRALRGIIVAHDFDQRTKSAARAVPNLSLVRYAVSFTFSPES
jgi:hypothetical protein